MTIYKPNVALLSKLSNSFASYHYDAEVPTILGARYPKYAVDLAIFTESMKKVGLKPFEAGTPCPYKTIRKTSDKVVSIGAKLKYVNKAENVMRRGGVEGDYIPDMTYRGRFPVFGELLWVKNDFTCMYVVTYDASISKSSYFDGDGNELTKESICQWIKSTDTFNKLCGKSTSDNRITDKEGYIIYQQNEDGTLRLDEKGKPMTMNRPPFKTTILENCDIRIKGKKIQFVTDEEYSLSELMAIRDAYHARIRAAIAERERNEQNNV